mmetsp:Transcript_35312/g.80832  ORF Transcript_35312/g.80832 Transcript_35312/m.80832 type:complete len:206 (-) Transcript_35312:1868-2485(-)
MPMHASSKALPAEPVQRQPGLEWRQLRQQQQQSAAHRRRPFSEDGPALAAVEAHLGAEALQCLRSVMPSAMMTGLECRFLLLVRGTLHHAHPTASPANHAGPPQSMRWVSKYCLAHYAMATPWHWWDQLSCRGQTRQLLLKQRLASRLRCPSRPPWSGLLGHSCGHCSLCQSSPIQAPCCRLQHDHLGHNRSSKTCSRGVQSTVV